MSPKSKRPPRNEAEKATPEGIEAEERKKNKEAIAKEEARKKKEEENKEREVEKELRIRLSLTVFPTADKPPSVLGKTLADRQEGHYPSRVGSKNPSAAPSASTTPLPSVPNTPRQ